MFIDNVQFEKLEEWLAGRVQHFIANIIVPEEKIPNYRMRIGAAVISPNPTDDQMETILLRIEDTYKDDLQIGEYENACWLILHDQDGDKTTFDIAIV